MRAGTMAIFGLALAGSGLCQGPAAAGGVRPRMEITLERFENGRWVQADPGRVFDKGDRVRFQFRANFSGFLYVIDHGTSGTDTQLFPRSDTGTDNHVAAGRTYQVPATDGSFRIEGPEGFDIVYWLVLPSRETSSAGAPAGPRLLGPPARKPSQARLIPRCDDTIFRARGECVDQSAGARQSTGESVPESLPNGARTASRDLTIFRQEDKSVVFAEGPMATPVLYEFRLAHR